MTYVVDCDLDPIQSQGQGHGTFELPTIAHNCTFPHSGVAGPLAAWCGGQICRPIVLGFGQELSSS